MGHVRCAIVFVVTLVFALPAHAANECKIQYGYHTGTGFNKQNRTKTTFIDAGATKTIDQGGMNFVKNLKDPKVKFYLGGATNITLEKNQVNPLLGYYLTSVTLAKATCLSTTSGSSQTPAIMVDSMRAAGATAKGIAVALRNTFGLGFTQIAQHMKNAGFTAKEVAKALKQGLGASARQVALAVKAAFTGSRKVVAIALKFAGFTTRVIAKALKQALGSSASEVAHTLKTSFGAITNVTARALKFAGFSVSQIASALSAEYQLTKQQTADILRELGYSTGQIARALNIRR